ncbi:putative Ig domain-containing protein [Calditrichota bacterium LG25]
MKARNLLKKIIIFVLALNWTHIQAQERVAAEFISKFPPPKAIDGTPYLDGLKQLSIKDHYLFVVDEYVGVQVLDISDPKNLQEVAVIYPENLAPTQNVYLTDSLAFMSCRLDGVWIIDIANPGAPQKISRIRPRAESYWVTANLPYIYIAEADSGVMIYDVQQPETPQLVGRIQTGGFIWGVGLIQNYLYLIDKRKGLLVYDITDPTAPVATGGQLEALKYTRSIFFEDNYAYAANGPAGLTVLDVSQPAKPKHIRTVNLKGYAYSSYKSGSTVFVGNDVLRELQFVDVQNPNEPFLIGKYKSNSHIYYALKRDIYVYTAADSATLVLRYNRPPVLADVQDQVVDENQTLTFQVKAFDPDDDAIFYSLSFLPEGAQFDSISGVFSWRPTFEQSGVYGPIVITAHERTQSQLTDSDTIRITVNHVNRPPTIAEIPDYEVDENQTLTFTIPEGEDPDKEDAGKLTYAAENLPEGATFDPQTRVFTWKPTYEQSGEYPIDFTVYDPAGAFAREATVITVHHVDRKPTLAEVPDQTVHENELLTFTLHGSDPDKEDQNALSYAAYNLPQGATFDPATATFSWKPTFEQSGVYKDLLFVFTAGALSDSITVNITVTHVNRPPVIAAVGDKTVDENQWLKFTVSGEDPDREDFGRLQITAENLPEGATFDPDSNLFKWKPTFEQSGVYPDVLFIIHDPSGLTDTAAVTITVNHVNRPPALAEIPAKVIDENQLLIFELQGSDPDREDQGKLIYTADGLPEGALLEGNQFSWTPTYDQSGVYKINFTVSDGRLSDSKSTTITVNHVNRPPVMAELAPQTVEENQPLTFTVAGSDPDKEDTGKLTLNALNLPEGAVFDPASGKFNWTPTFEQSGVYQVSFTIQDPAGLSDTLTVPITVNHVNRTPVFAEQPPQVVDENQPLNVQLIPATDPDKEDEGKLKYTALNLPQGASFDQNTLTLSWTPTYEQSGVYTVTFQVTDGEFTVEQPLQITVNHVNRPPVLQPIADQTIDENQPWQLAVKATDPDKEDEGKLRFSATNLPQGMTFDSTNAVFSWTPTFEQSGVYSAITVKVTDSGHLTDQKQFSITVNHVNRAPSLEPIPPIQGVENSPITFQLKGSDPDKEDDGKLVYSCANLPEGAVLDAQSGAFSWTPNFLQAGAYKLQFKVTDSGGLFAEQSVSITIDDLNRPPQLQPIEAKKVFENQTLSFKVIGSDEDTDNTLTYSAEGLPTGAQFDAASQMFTWRPTFEQAGTYQVTFKLTDGKEEASVSAPIEVVNVNRPPQFTGLTDQQVKENERLRFTVTASDPDAGTTLQLQAQNLPEGAQFSADNGTFEWTPTFEQAGVYAVTFSVSDGDTTVSKEVKITVQNVNRPPVFNEIGAQQVKENEELRFTISASDPDAGTELKFSAQNLPDGASFDPATQTFVWKPNFDQQGEHQVVFTVSDGESEVKQTVVISVQNVNRPPTINGPTSNEAQAGEAIQLQFNGNDPDGDALKFSGDNLPSGAKIDDAGNFTWTPEDGQVGTHSFVIKVSDGQQEASINVKIDVKPKPQPAPADTTGN